MKYSVILLMLLGITLIMSCRKDKICLSGDMGYMETAVEDVPELNNVIIDFDIVNKSSTEYSYQDEETGKVFMVVVVTTKDGEVYETEKLLSVNPSLPSGDTTHVDIWADYGEGKSYKSYTMHFTCE